MQSQLNLDDVPAVNHIIRPSPAGTLMAAVTMLTDRPTR